MKEKQGLSEKIEKNQREKNSEKKNEKRDKLKKERERVVWLELERSGGFTKFNLCTYVQERIFGLYR